MRFLSFAATAALYALKSTPMFAGVDLGFRASFPTRGPSGYRKSPSAASPENYRWRTVKRTASREAERHLRQMAAGQLDFSASDPNLWRNRTFAVGWNRFGPRARHVH